MILIVLGCHKIARGHMMKQCGIKGYRALSISATAAVNRIVVITKDAQTIQLVLNRRK